MEQPKHQASPSVLLATLLLSFDDLLEIDTKRSLGLNSRYQQTFEINHTKGMLNMWNWYSKHIIFGYESAIL